MQCGACSGSPQLAQFKTLTVSKSVGNDADLVTGKLKLLLETLKSLHGFHNANVYCAIGRIGPAGKCTQGKICAINKKSLL